MNQVEVVLRAGKGEEDPLLERGKAGSQSVETKRRPSATIPDAGTVWESQSHRFELQASEVKNRVIEVGWLFQWGRCCTTEESRFTSCVGGLVRSRISATPKGFIRASERELRVWMTRLAMTA